jgi:hypothetical protein
MVSVWTVVVAIISGLSGGALGTWLQIRHERHEAFRERLITAADDLSTGLLQAIIGLDEAHSTCLEHAFMNAQNQVTFRDPGTGHMPAETKEALARSRALIGEARARVGRVALLFGPVSAPDRAATLAIWGLRDAFRALDAWPVPDLEKFSDELAHARKYLQDFNTWALSDAKGRPWYARWPIALWIRRQRFRWRKRRADRAGP